MDLLPGDKVRIRHSYGSGNWSGKNGTVTWASDADGEDRIYDVSFDDMPSSTFTASEVIALDVAQ